MAMFQTYRKVKVSLFNISAIVNSQLVYKAQFVPHHHFHCSSRAELLYFFFNLCNSFHSVIILERIIIFIVYYFLKFKLNCRIEWFQIYFRFNSLSYGITSNCFTCNIFLVFWFNCFTEICWLSVTSFENRSRI